MLCTEDKQVQSLSVFNCSKTMPRAQIYTGSPCTMPVMHTSPADTQYVAY